MRYQCNATNTHKKLFKNSPICPKMLLWYNAIKQGVRAFVTPFEIKNHCNRGNKETTKATCFSTNKKGTTNKKQGTIYS